MKMRITNKDVRKLSGKFIIQIDSEKEDVVLNDTNWGFYQEKRISLVCGLKLVGFFYERKSFETEDEFVMFFNDFVCHSTKPDMVEAQKGKRFHRLLTSKEIDFVCQKIKSENY